MATPIFGNEDLVVGRTAGFTGTPGFTAGGANGAGSAGCMSGFVQHFFHMVKLSKEISKAIPIIAAGEENTQWLDLKGSSN